MLPKQLYFKLTCNITLYCVEKKKVSWTREKKIINSIIQKVNKTSPCVFKKIMVIYVGMICKLDVALWLRSHFQTDSDLLIEQDLRKFTTHLCQILVIKFTFGSSCDPWFWYHFVTLKSMAETKADIVSSSSQYSFKKKWQKMKFYLLFLLNSKNIQ